MAARGPITIAKAKILKCNPEKESAWQLLIDQVSGNPLSDEDIDLVRNFSIAI